MFEYYLKRFFVKVICWFVPSKAARLALRSKMHFGKELVEFKDVDSYVPKSVLDMMSVYSPLDFLSEYKTRLNPTPLAQITPFNPPIAPPLIKSLTRKSQESTSICET